MKVRVAKRSPEYLQVELRNSPITYIGWGLVFIVAGCWALWQLAVATRVEASTAGLTYSRAFLGLVTTDELSATPSEIQSVDLVLDEGFISRSYEVAITTADRTLTTHLPSADGDEKQVLADRIKGALGGGPAIEYADRQGLILGTILSAVCIGGGMLCMAALQRIRITGDRASGTIAVSRKRGVSRRHQEQTIRIGRGIEARVKVSRAATTQSTPTYQVMIAGVPLSRLAAFTEVSAAETAEIVNDWLAGPTR